MRLLLAVLLTAFWAGPSFSQMAAAPQAPSYVGRWYIEDPAVCKGRDQEGLLVYGAKQVEGYEYSCDVTRTRTKGKRTEVTLRCLGEGRTSIEKETVEVVDGRLKRTIKVNGKARMVDYHRCP